MASNGFGVADAPGKRGRKAQPPNPDDGPVAAFAHQLWLLKRHAGDPSFSIMCAELGAAASRSSLAAAARGTTLPSWETTWEFVRVLAVERLGADARETEHQWRARWDEARAAAINGGGIPCMLSHNDERELIKAPTVQVRRWRSDRVRGTLGAVAALAVVAGLTTVLAAPHRSTARHPRFRSRDLPA